RELTPKVESLSVNGSSGYVYVGRGESADAILSLTRYESDSLSVRWELLKESESLFVGGDAEPPLQEHATAVTSNGSPLSVKFVLPDEVGAYRLFAYAIADDLYTASANMPIYVR